MTKPLDGIGLHTYCHCLRFPKETQELLASIRDSPPGRTPGTRLSTDVRPSNARMVPDLTYPVSFS